MEIEANNIQATIAFGEINKVPKTIGPFQGQTR